MTALLDDCSRIELEIKVMALLLPAELDDESLRTTAILKVFQSLDIPITKQAKNALLKQFE